MSYAICRIQKCGSSHDIAGEQIHDRRERNHSNSNPDIDFNRTKNNYCICDNTGGRSFTIHCHDVYPQGRRAYGYALVYL